MGKEMMGCYAQSIPSAATYPAGSLPVEFGSPGEVSTKDKLLDEVFRELTFYYRRLSQSPLKVSQGQGANFLFDALESEYSNRV